MMRNGRWLMMSALMLGMIVGFSIGAIADRTDAPDQPLNFLLNTTFPNQDTVIRGPNTPAILAGALEEEELHVTVDDELRTYEVAEIAFIENPDRTEKILPHPEKSEVAPHKVELHLRTGETVAAEWGTNGTEETQWLSFRMPTQNGQVVEVMTHKIWLFVPAGQFWPIPNETRSSLENAIVNVYQLSRNVLEMVVLNNEAVLAGSMKFDSLRFKTSDGEVAVTREQLDRVYRSGEDRFTAKLEDGDLVQGELQSGSRQVTLGFSRETIDLPMDEVGQFVMNDLDLFPSGGGPPTVITPKAGKGPDSSDE